MNSSFSIRFFDGQFQQQARESDLRLNPFEQIALPYLRGRVLDYGCGLGNLAVAAAQRGCSVVALDASHTAIEHLRRIAAEQSLPIEAAVADLRSHELAEEFDSVVSIGLLMFFDCASAFRQLRNLQSHLRAGGVAVINVLVEGTTYLDMFDPMDHCLFSRGDMHARFSGWEILHSEYQDFAAPKEQVKSFSTLVARKPH
jgi:tellurite methyltransferase